VAEESEQQRHFFIICPSWSSSFGPVHRYSIISPTRARTVVGFLRRSALAALRLTASSNLVGITTGKSAGLAPLRIWHAGARPHQPAGEARTTPTRSTKWDDATGQNFRTTWWRWRRIGQRSSPGPTRRSLRNRARVIENSWQDCAARSAAMASDCLRFTASFHHYYRFQPPQPDCAHFFLRGRARHRHE
jgi:hypothetical protein